jgi:hypothetical protein
MDHDRTWSWFDRYAKDVLADETQRGLASLQKQVVAAQ